MLVTSMWLLVEHAHFFAKGKILVRVRFAKVMLAPEHLP